MRAELQPAFILHTRPYRDTSLLVDLLSKDFGCITLVAKGARKPKQHQRNLLQPFLPILVSWQGKSQLKTLISVEASSQRIELQEKFLYSAMYLNELLSYLLPPDDPIADIYDAYQTTLSRLQQKDDLEPCLREFEFLLLAELGYGLDFSCEATSGEVIEPGRRYGLVLDEGFILESHCQENIPAYYLGEHLISIAKGEYHDNEVSRTAKHIIRAALQPHLRGKQLKSRELFQ
jgi:DNA repair protein RecO (recombination protein O)